MDGRLLDISRLDLIGLFHCTKDADASREGAPRLRPLLNPRYLQDGTIATTSAVPSEYRRWCAKMSFGWGETDIVSCARGESQGSATSQVRTRSMPSLGLNCLLLTVMRSSGRLVLIGFDRLAHLLLRD